MPPQIRARSNPDSHHGTTPPNPTGNLKIYVRVISGQIFIIEMDPKQNNNTLGSLKKQLQTLACYA